ncbi:unnamed protein product, partial [Scytosiphon promiscuus]
FALVLKPNDEYRDAVEVLELALDLGEGNTAAADGTSGGGGIGAKTSPQKLDKAKRVREKRPANRRGMEVGGRKKKDNVLGASVAAAHDKKSDLSLTGSTPPPGCYAPGLSEGLEGSSGRRTRLSLLDDLQEEEGRLTSRRKKELERKKKHRLFHFIEKMKEGIIVRRHLAHHTCDQVVLQSTVSGRRSENAKPGKRAPLVSLKEAAGVRLNKNRAETIKTADIAIVLPATDPDPSQPGFFGTRALRLSEDIPNPSRTFSLL